MEGLGLRFQGSGFGAWGLLFRVWGSKFGDKNLGLRAEGSGFRVWGMGFSFWT